MIFPACSVRRSYHRKTHHPTHSRRHKANNSQYNNDKRKIELQEAVLLVEQEEANRIRNLDFGGRFDPLAEALGITQDYYTNIANQLKEIDTKYGLIRDLNNKPVEK
jgi:hypothetical protein